MENLVPFHFTCPSNAIAHYSVFPQSFAGKFGNTLSPRVKQSASARTLIVSVTRYVVVHCWHQRMGCMHGRLMLAQNAAELDCMDRV